MLDAVLRLLITFVPPTRRHDPVAQRQSLLLVGILSLVVGSLPINMAYQIYTGRWSLLVFSSVTAVLYGGALVVYRTRDIHDTLCTVALTWGFLGVFGTALLSGGIYSSVSPIAALLPLLALSLRNRQSAMHWTILTAIGFVGLAAIEVAGLTPEGQREAFERPFPVAVNLLLMLAYATGFALFLESLNHIHRTELVEQRRSADDANAAKSAFLANMSHELRTPMNGVLGLTEIVLLDNELPIQHRHRLQTVLQSGRALVDLLNDILDLSKVEEGQLVLEEIPWSPRRVIRDVERLFGEVARRKGLELTLKLDSAELPAWIYGDPTRVRQVVCNLVGNAVKFTTEGSVELALSCTDNILCVSVRDTGPGIAADVQARIFEPFTQADASMARRHGGTGLGLAISRRLTRRMGGEIQVDSVLGEGSEFRIRLPIRPASAPEGWEEVPTNDLVSRIPLPEATVFGPDRPPLPDSSKLNEAQFAGIEVLVVEDVGVNRMVAQNMLEQLGCSVDVAVDGEEGLASILGKPDYDVVLMDWHMPNMDGLEVTRLVRLAGFHTPIVGLTASVRPEEKAEALAAGMDDFMGKPFTHQQLQQMLSDVLSRPTPKH